MRSECLSSSPSSHTSCPLSRVPRSTHRSTHTRHTHQAHRDTQLVPRWQVAARLTASTSLGCCCNQTSRSANTRWAHDAHTLQSERSERYASLCNAVAVRSLSVLLAIGLHHSARLPCAHDSDSATQAQSGDRVRFGKMHAGRERPDSHRMHRQSALRLCFGGGGTRHAVYVTARLTHLLELRS